MECFQAIFPLVVNFIDRLNPANKEDDREKSAATTAETPNNRSHAEADRLLQLLVKGILYEYAVDYCQAQALEGKNGNLRKFLFFFLKKFCMEIFQCLLIFFFSTQTKKQIHTFTPPSSEIILFRSITYILA